MTPEQRRYVKKLQQIINRFDKLDDQTTRRTLAMLKTYRAHLADELLSAGTDWRVHQLTELQRSVDQMTTGFESQLTADLRAAQLQASDLGAALAVEPLQAAGVRGVFLSPSPAQVNTLLDFSADLIQSIGNDMRSGINRQLQLAILGERGPVDAMKAVTQVLGIDARYGVWKKRRDPARGIAARAETIVRTEMNRIYNVSHQAQQTAMAETTPGLLKRWIATPDARTRPSHLAAHRRYMDEPIPVDEPFRVGGWDLMYPGDPGGPAAETINCRCRSITIHPLVGNVSLGTDDRIRAEQERRGQVAAEKKAQQTAQVPQEMEIRSGHKGEIENFQLYNEDNQGEEVLVIEAEGKVVAYAQVTDYNIYFIESERKGGGRALIEYLKEHDDYLLAHNVEETAKGFWRKMGFEFAHRDAYGGENWDWE